MMTPEKMVYENKINDLEQQLKYFTNKSKRLEQDNKKLNNIINELEKYLEKRKKKLNTNNNFDRYARLEIIDTIYKLQELKECK